MATSNYSSDAIESRSTPGAGIGVFAKSPIEAQTTLYTTSDEYFSIIYRRYWKEVCAHCFNYDRGIDWKVKANSIGVVFCTEECKAKYMDRLSPDLLVFLSNAEDYARRRKQVKPVPREEGEEDDDIIPDSRIIDQTWVDSQNTLVEVLHAISRDKPSKSQRKLISEVQAAGLRSYDDDSDTDIDSLKNLASYLTTNILSPSTVTRTLELSTTLEPFTLSRLLDQQVNQYLALVSLLPPSLTKYALPTTAIAKILAVDRSNSFGIWSGSSDKSSSQSEERSELLGSMLVPSLSRFNHSCTPTVSKHRYRRTWTFATMDVVNTDEEIFITYLGGDEKTLNVEDRRQRLLNGWGFVCGCTKCTAESTDSTQSD
ncbi:hypothetical protein E3P99_00417 [Wallemia hederae]|uniref:SET domain-containing protein n=1 Tax=Wallemia hederae TaxID=1540922 RepID=A0A4T0FVR2_9BASI|nr:hypothetical protein E3P99_00417 [Wallemia hederae]